MSIGLCALLVLALIMMSMGIPLAFLAGAMVFSAAAGLLCTTKLHQDRAAAAGDCVTIF